MSAETPDDVAFGARVHAYMLRHPEVLAEAFDRLQSNQDAHKATAAKAAIDAHRQMLEQDPRDPVLGNAAGAITVVELFDYRCPYCRSFEPTLDTILAENPDVRLVLKPLFVLDTEDGSHISEDAARAALAAKAQGRFASIHHALLARKDLDEAGVVAVVKAADIDLHTAKTLERSAATTSELNDIRTLAQALDVDGTPAFIVGQQIVAGADADRLRQAISAARATATAER